MFIFVQVPLIFPIMYILATIVITGLPMIITPIETAIGLAMIASGVPVYFIFVAWTKKPEMIRRWSCKYQTKLKITMSAHLKGT